MEYRRSSSIHIFILVSLLCLFGKSAAAQGSEEESRLKSLRKIAAVRVQVTDFDPDFKTEFKKAGMTESLLETMVRRRIEAAGIKVLRESEPDALDQTGVVLLSLQAHSPISARKFTLTGEAIDFSATGGQLAYLYLIRIEFRQKVILARDSSVGLTTATWAVDTFGIRRLNRLTPVVYDQVDLFVNAYRSENQ